MQKLNASKLQSIEFSQLTINQFLTDVGVAEERDKISFWARIGVPFFPDEPRVISFDEFMRAIIDLVMITPNSFNASLDQRDFLDFAIRQGLTPKEATLVMTKIGWVKNKSKKVAAILTRLIKAIARPEIEQ